MEERTFYVWSEEEGRENADECVGYLWVEKAIRDIAKEIAIYRRDDEYATLAKQARDVTSEFKMLCEDEDGNRRAYTIKASLWVSLDIKEGEQGDESDND